MTKNKIYILMVCSALFWSGAFIAGKYTVPLHNYLYLNFFTVLLCHDHSFFCNEKNES